MKRNIQFFSIVISLLLLSSVILTGCMYAIAADNGEMKSYDLKGETNNSTDGANGEKERTKKNKAEKTNGRTRARQQAKIKPIAL